MSADTIDAAPPGNAPVAASRSSRWQLIPFGVTIVMVAYAGLFVAMGTGLLGSHKLLLGPDFVTFYSGSWMAQHGNILPIWSMPDLFAVENQLTGATNPVPWFYPPTFLLLMLPAALLPYLASLAIWVIGASSLWIASVRKATTIKHSWWLVLGFPGWWWCIMDGQNGVLTAAFAGFAAWAWSKDRRILSGAFIGLLAIKPHLAIGLAIVLLAARAWRTIAAAAGTALAFLAVSVMVFGWQTIPAWITSMGDASANVQSGFLPWQNMPTVYASLRKGGLEHLPALGIHAVVALATVVVLWIIGKRAKDWRWMWAAGMVGGFIILPYGYDYDLVWLLLPILWLAETRTSKPEKVILALAWVAPLVGTDLAEFGHTLQFTPLVLAAVLWMVWRRVQAERSSGQERRTPG